MPRTKLTHYKSQTAMRFRHPSDHFRLEMTPPFLLSHPDYLDGVSTTQTAPTHQPFSCPKTHAQVLHSPCLQITENPQPQSVGHPHFYGCLNQQYIEKSCAAQAQSICIHLLWPYIPSAQSLQHSRQVVVFRMVAHVHTRVCLGEMLGPLPLVQFLMS